MAAGPSMAPELPHGRSARVDRNAYASSRPEPGDVVLFKAPDGSETFKRVYAVGGDVIEFREAALWINGQRLRRAAATKCGKSSERASKCMVEHVGRVRVRIWAYPAAPAWGPISVPDDSVFVLGDHRGMSNDSRNRGIGPIPLATLLGKVVQRGRCVPHWVSAADPGPAPKQLRRFGRTTVWLDGKAWVESSEDGETVWTHPKGGVLTVREVDQRAAFVDVLTAKARASGTQVVASGEHLFGGWCGSVVEVSHELEGQALHTVSAAVNDVSRGVVIVGHAEKGDAAAVRRIRSAIESAHWDPRAPAYD